MNPLLGKINREKNLQFITASINCEDSRVASLYDLCQRYSPMEYLIVEPSLKISDNEINQRRFALPIFFGNFIIDQNNQKVINQPLLRRFCADLLQLTMGHLITSLITCLHEYIIMQVDDLSKSSDLIVGYDFKENIFKFYVDNCQNSIECLEFNLIKNIIKRKIYTIIVDNKYRQISQELDSESLQLLRDLDLTEPNYKLIYKVQDDVYHIVLKDALQLNNENVEKISDYFRVKKKLNFWFKNLENQNYRVHVISIKKDNRRIKFLTVYVRPIHWVTRVANFGSIIRIFF